MMLRRRGSPDESDADIVVANFDSEEAEEEKLIEEMYVEEEADDEVDAEQADELLERLQRARQGRDQWWADRRAGDWDAEQRPEADFTGGMSLLGRLNPFSDDRKSNSE